jgi:predicted TIM-barrel fold metal-dependent hydrolase
MSPSPLADSHLHIFSRGFPGAGGRPVLGADPEIDAYEARRRDHGIAAGLVIGYEAGGIDPDNNRYIRSLASAHPWMATLAFVDPRTGAGPDEIARRLEEGHLGIVGYVPDAGTAAAVASWPEATWRQLDARGAMVSLNATPAGTPGLRNIVARYGGCRFLFSHLGLPGRYPEPPSMGQAGARIAALIELAAFDNVMVKISGLYAVSDPAHGYPHAAAAPFIALLLERFGPSRCLWASDFSPALEVVSFPQTVSIPWLDGLAPAERDQVMGGNLLGLLRTLGWTGDTP